MTNRWIKMCQIMCSITINSVGYFLSLTCCRKMTSSSAHRLRLLEGRWSLFAPKSAPLKGKGENPGRVHLMECKKIRLFPSQHLIVRIVVKRRRKVDLWITNMLKTFGWKRCRWPQKSNRHVAQMGHCIGQESAQASRVAAENSVSGEARETLARDQERMGNSQRILIHLLLYTGFVVGNFAGHI